MLYQPLFSETKIVCDVLFSDIYKQVRLHNVEIKKRATAYIKQNNVLTKMITILILLLLVANLFSMKL